MHLFLTGRKKVPRRAPEIHFVVFVFVVFVFVVVIVVCPLSSSLLSILSSSSVIDHILSLYKFKELCL